MVTDGEIADDVVGQCAGDGRPFLSWCRRSSSNLYSDRDREIRCVCCATMKRPMQAYMNYLDAMERQGKAAESRQGDGRRARCSSRPPSKDASTNSDDPGQRQDAVAVLLQPGR